MLQSNRDANSLRMHPVTIRGNIFLGINTTFLKVQEFGMIDIDKLVDGFSYFRDATKRAELQGFTNNREITIFVPDNVAFSRVADKFDYKTLSIQELRKAILRHVIMGEVRLKELQSGPVSTNVNNYNQVLSIILNF